ncbi:hypothetical protein CCR94_21410 [Rhodoblastus sphagnicola]|uniref:DUF2325 domain-containing protein n=1 Tax=Rhodoblastus sphagnicola TaxID=333368 RepID=A0A2S6MX94_9HYPH|nr:DUF2325 domain-containing protein [Rhodoblastus sphagnicola]MBB4199318.1 hypothetical protein [Rhodoblastus sphagnicola]PPQ26981.1 hypothetical protein CCR94_21410 [Rhodoblastus sphagnicola]
MKKKPTVAPAALALASSGLTPILADLVRPPANSVTADHRADGRRLTIWEVRGASLCSIVGTCMSLGELRRIAKKCGVVDDPWRMSDYDIHGTLTARMSTETAAARAVTKHLDAKFEGAIRKARALESAEDFIGYWEAAVDAGLAPGAYWAMLTHPKLPPDVESRVYGEIHMMSHMSGASNRGDARAIAEARREKGELARRLTARIDERAAHLREAQAEMARLRDRVAAMETLEDECALLRGLADHNRLASELRAQADELELLRQENALLKREATGFELQCEHLRARLHAAEATVAEPARGWTGDESLDDGADGDGKTASLCGRCLLYVGGRPQTVCKLRQLIAGRNGQLLHHDGGLENSSARLGELVRQADAVFFPVDCVSHSAVEAVKKICQSEGKPMRPLRTASATTFLRALESALVPTGSPP